MNLQTFRATTMAEALGQVKASMGTDAVILHTRTFHTRYLLGLRRREMVEITAGKGFNFPERNPRRARQQLQNQQPLGGGGGGGGNSGAAVGPAAYRQIAAAAGHSVQPVQVVARDSVVENSKAILQTPGAATSMMMGISQEMSALKAMVQDLVTQTRREKCPQVPEDLFDYYMQLCQNQVAEELATEITRALQKQIRPEHLNQPDYVRERMAEQIEKLIPTSGPIVRTKQVGPHVVALIGPTGVGKTTTVAKLAANLKLREKHRVGLITLDTYRIAAVDQLTKYAEIIETPLRVVNTAQELRSAVRDMNGCDFVLIDTAGRSPNDQMKISELKSLLAVAEPDEVHLVLSSTASESCIELAANRFGDVRVDKVIFTKLDEAAHVGVVFNVVRKLNKSLSYVTTGQNVPNDIEVGKGRRLAQLIVGGAGAATGSAF